MPNADGTMTRYEYNKLHQRCARCGTQDAYTMIGRSYCAVCAEKNCAESKKYYEEHKKQSIAKAKERVDAWRKAGLCTRCGKKPAELGRSMCVQCAQKARDSDRKLRQKRGAISNEKARALGLCRRCRKNPVIKGKGYCRTCMDWWLSVRNKERKNEFFTFMGSGGGGGSE